MKKLKNDEDLVYDKESGCHTSRARVVVVVAERQRNHHLQQLEEVMNHQSPYSNNNDSNNSIELRAAAAAITTAEPPKLLSSSSNRPPLQSHLLLPTTSTATRQNNHATGDDNDDMSSIQARIEKLENEIKHDFEHYNNNNNANSSNDHTDEAHKDRLLTLFSLREKLESQMQQQQQQQIGDHPATSDEKTEKQRLLAKKRMLLLKKRRQICIKKYESNGMVGDGQNGDNDFVTPKPPKLVALEEQDDGLSSSLSSCDYFRCGLLLGFNTNGSSGDGGRCSGCNNIMYCSIGCQQLDWNRHKKECTRYKNRYSNRNNRKWEAAGSDDDDEDADMLPMDIMLGLDGTTGVA